MSKQCLRDDSLHTVLNVIREFSQNSKSYSDNSIQIQWAVYIQWVVFSQFYRKDVYYYILLYIY